MILSWPGHPHLEWARIAEATWQIKTSRDLNDSLCNYWQGPCVVDRKAFGMILVLESWNVLDFFKRLKRLFEKDVSSAPQTCLFTGRTTTGSEWAARWAGRKTVGDMQTCERQKKNASEMTDFPVFWEKTTDFSLWKNLKVPLTIPLTYLDFPNEI